MRFENIRNKARAGLAYVWDSINQPKDLTPQEKRTLDEMDALAVSETEHVAFESLANYKPEFEPPELTLRERIGGLMTRALVMRPFKNLDSTEKTRETVEQYETAHVETRYFDDQNVVWFNFSGLGDGNAPRFFGHPARQMCPQQGLQINFEGPTGIVNLDTGDQLVRCTEMVMQKVREELKKYPNYKVRIFGYSAGTHLSTYVAHTLGKELGEPIDRVINVATGDSIMYGSHSTPVTERIAQTHKNAGEDKYSLTDKVFEYVQKANVEYLPKGERTMLIGGTNDRFIPFHGEGGTNDHINLQKRYNPEVGTYIADGFDHVSIIMHLIKLQREGVDVFKLGDPVEKLPFADMADHIQEFLLEATGSGYDPEFPNLIVDEAHRIIEQQKVTSNAHSLSLQAVREIFENKRLVTEGFVTKELPHHGIVISEEVITTADEEGIDRTVAFLQENGRATKQNQRAA